MTEFVGLRVVLVASLLLLAGCNGWGVGPSTPTASDTPAPDTPTVTPTDTPTETATSTATPTVTRENWSQERKYRYFADHYEERVGQYINVASVTVDDGTLEIRYIMDNPNNKSRERQENAAVLRHYSSLAAGYTNEEPSHKSWVPKRLNVTEVAPNGEVYFRSHTNYSLAMQYESGEMRYFGYFVEYTNAGEHGPAWDRYND